MGDIKRGTTGLSGLYRGDTAITGVYRGTQEIWTSSFSVELTSKSANYNVWTHSNVNNDPTANNNKVDTGYMGSAWNFRVRSRYGRNTEQHKSAGTVIDTRPGGSMQGKNIRVTYDMTMQLDRPWNYGSFTLTYYRIPDANSKYTGTNYNPLPSYGNPNNDHLKQIGGITDWTGGSSGGTQRLTGSTVFTPSNIPQESAGGSLLQLGVVFRGREASGQNPMGDQWWQKCTVASLLIEEE